MLGAKINGACCVLTRQPSSRHVRRTLSPPIREASFSSDLSVHYATIALHLALTRRGDWTDPRNRAEEEAWYSPTSPREFAEAFRQWWHQAHSGTVDNAVIASRSMPLPRPVVYSIPSTLDEIDVFVIQHRSPGKEPNSAVSARPAKGSSEVTCASPSAPFTRCSTPSGEKSLVDVPQRMVAILYFHQHPKSIPREPDSLSVSAPMRTTVENSSPSRIVTSASLAPALTALATISAASCCKPVLLSIKVAIFY